MKGQSQLLGSVLITSIILALAGSAFLWGRPLIQKSTDKATVDNLLLQLKSLDSAIQEVAATGSSKTVSLTLKDGDQISLSDQVVVETTITVPVVTSSEFAPLNSYDLPEREKLIKIVTNKTVNVAGTGLDLGEEGFAVKNSNDELIESGFFDVYVYKTVDCSDYCFVCIVNHTNTPTNSECAKEGGSLVVDGVDYNVAQVSSDGDNVFILGGVEENKGVLGVDVSGIISAKSKLLGSSKGLLTTLRLSYRGLVDSGGVTHRIKLVCNSGCFASSKNVKVRVARSNVIRTSNSIDTYINIELI